MGVRHGLAPLERAAYTAFYQLSERGERRSMSKWLPYLLMRALISLICWWLENLGFVFTSGLALTQERTLCYKSTPEGKE